MTPILQEAYLSKIERIIIIASALVFLLVLFISLGLGLRSALFGVGQVTYEDTVSGILLSMLLALPALYAKKKANERALREGVLSQLETEKVKKEIETLSYGIQSVRGSWLLFIGMAIIGFLFFLYYFLFR